MTTALALDRVIRSACGDDAVTYWADGSGAAMYVRRSRKVAGRKPSALTEIAREAMAYGGASALEALEQQLRAAGRDMNDAERTVRGRLTPGVLR